MADANNTVCGGNGNQGGACTMGDTAHCLITFDLVEDCGYDSPFFVDFPASGPSPTPDIGNPGLSGDPHLKSWTGEWFDVRLLCCAFH